jgi:PIN domain nuclease of toxin-antitoxin system
MTAVLLDTHVLHWWSTDATKLSLVAATAIDEADHVTVSAITWFELSWLARHERILLTIPVGTWLEQMAGQVETVGITPAIADAAVSLPATFPADPMDRLIFATAVERGCRLITKDGALRSHRVPRPVALW